EFDNIRDLFSTKKPDPSIKLPFVKSDSVTEIAQAIAQWQQQGNLEKAVSIAPKLLYQNFEGWRYLRNPLLKSPTNPQWNIQKAKKRARKTMEDLYRKQQSGTKIIPLRFCSTIIVYHTAILSVPDNNFMTTAIIKYRLGLAYSQITPANPQTAYALLSTAKDYYTLAYDIVN